MLSAPTAAASSLAKAVLIRPSSLLFCKERRADNNALCARTKDGLGACDGADAAANLAGKAFADLLDESGIVTLSHGGVEVDELDERVACKAIDPVFEVIEGELEFFALHELNDLAAEEVDRWDQHGSLTGIPL